LPQREILPQSWFFLNFYYSSRNIAKKNKEIEIKECVASVNV
jgi:hypothetical protein